MNTTPLQKKVQILQLLVLGNSMRSIERIVGCSINTVTKLLYEAGEACAVYHDANVRNLKSKRIQCDEIWAFCYAKNKNVEAAKAAPVGAGDAWTWTAIDADSKLIVSYLVGGRDTEYATEFMLDVKSRLSNHVQLSTDGHKPYMHAVDKAFDWKIDYAMIVKHYGADVLGNGRYSPPVCTGARKQVVSGCPDKDHVSTSYVERQNLTMRTHMRRFTRLTNGFSKKVENHLHAVALHFMFYNFCKIHKTLRVTPAMEAEVSSHVWSIEELARLIPEPVAKKRGPYKKSV
jgi:IS1 family transposase